MRLGTSDPIFEVSVSDCCWPLASAGDCHHANVRVDRSGSSPCFRQHGPHWRKFLCIPVRRLFQAVPIAEHNPRLLEPTMCDGVVLRYRFPLVDRWIGEYVEAHSLGLPQTTLLHRTQSRSACWICPHTAKERCANRQQAGFAFLLKKRYARANTPMDSEEAYWHQGDASAPLRDAFASADLGAEKMTPKPPIPIGSKPPPVGEVSKVKEASPSLKQVCRQGGSCLYGGWLWYDPPEDNSPFWYVACMWKSVSKHHRPDMINSLQAFRP